MESKELRIGNLVKWYDVSKVLELHSEKNKFDNVYIECEESFEWTEYNKLEPIPLTEEWLLKFGFIKHLDTIYSHWSKETGIFEISTRLPYGSYGLWANGTLGCFQYVHQLQNLYFDLTGAELTVA